MIMKLSKSINPISSNADIENAIIVALSEFIAENLTTFLFLLFNNKFVFTKKFLRISL